MGDAENKVTDKVAWPVVGPVYIRGSTFDESTYYDLFLLQKDPPQSYLVTALSALT